MMKNVRLLLSFLFCLLAMNLPAQSLEKGVSKELAEQRKASISNVAYNLTFNIPASKKDKVTGKAVISFSLKDKEDVVLDFQGKLQGNVLVGKKKRKVSTKNEHIIVPMKYLKPGPVTLTFEFTALDDALNRNEDYMYSLFVPDHARSAFPCFDQPDLRARFTTTLNVPQGWKTICSDGSNPIPTYLYSFVAGNYQEKTTTLDGRTMRALYRETDPDKVKQLDKIFDEAAQSLKWMEGYTGIQCPFKEYGLVILPGYQFGGMEHPGAIQLSDRRVFLGKNPTKEEELSRMELIAHETSHLWFGDMVSLKWFADVWAKEVFANFMTFQEHLTDNCNTFCHFEPLSEADLALLEETAQMIRDFPLVNCTACNYCMPCPYGIDIPGIFGAYNKAVNGGLVAESAEQDDFKRLRRRYLALYNKSVESIRQADHCISCGTCTPHCPQNIRIPRELARIDAYVEKLKQGNL